MPQASSLYQSPLLSQIAVDFKNREYVADQVLTPVGVPRMLGQYLVWDRGVTFKLPKTEMAQNGQANLIDLKATKTPFALSTYALMAVLDPLEVDQAPESQIRAMKVAKLANALLLDREIKVAAQLTSTSVMTNNTTLVGVDQWDDPGSFPITAIAAVNDSLPKRANTLIASRAVITALRTHSTVLDAIKYTQTGGLAPLSALASLFEVDRILVGEAFKDTAGENLTEVKSAVWGKDAILCYVDPSPPSPVMDSPTLGYIPTFGGGTPTMRTYNWVDQNYGTAGGVERIKVETAYSVLVSAPSMGYLWKAAIS